jgi:hypothetical protein
MGKKSNGAQKQQAEEGQIIQWVKSQTVVRRSKLKKDR